MLALICLLLMAGTAAATATARFTFSPSGGTLPLLVTVTDSSNGSPLNTWDWNWGDGTPHGSGKTPGSHAYTTAGTYTINLTVNGGNSITKSIKITALNATANNTSGPLPLPVSFGTTANSNTHSYAWTFGDGGLATTASPSHTYTTAGTYTPTLTVTDSVGNNPVTVSTASITVKPPVPVASFTYAATGLSVVFTDKSSNTPTSWDWDFGDSTTHGTQQSPTHIYAVKGTYTVTLKATNAGGSSSPVTQQITVTAPVVTPVADFNYVATDLSVQFTDNSSNTPTSWSWVFGDGGVSTDPNPSHLYTVAGTYHVTLISTNSAGNSNPVQKDVTVTAPILKPVADFNYVATDLSVQFTDNSSNTPTSWSWVFGDGGVSTDPNPSHLYTVAGTYHVTLISTNSAGNSNPVQKDVTVTAPILKPVADFNYVATDLSVQFTDNSSNTPTSWSWVFGDGGVSTDPNPSHLYTVVGTYHATLTVTNSAGSSDPVQKDVTVTAPIDFTVTPQTGDVPLHVTLNDTSTVGDGSREWIVDDFNTGLTDQTVEYTLDTIGTHNITLIEYDSDGFEFDNVTKQVTVNDVPIKADFIAQGSYGYATFEDNCSGVPNSLTWNFGDGAIDTYYWPGAINHDYAIPGVYTVTLTATKSDGTSSTISKQVTILAEPVVNFTATPEKGTAPLTVNFTDISDSTINSLNWDFGEGDPSSEKTPSHIYETPGTYTVVLHGDVLENGEFVYNAYATKTITVVAPVPVAEFDTTPAIGTVGQEIQFNDNSTGEIATYDWNFGDGSTHSVEKTPKYTYGKADTYQVTLIVTNSYGVSSTPVTHDVVVNPVAPVASFDVTPIKGTSPLTVTATDTSTGVVTGRVWYIDGVADNSSESTMTHAFDNAAVHTISLEVSNAGGSNTSLPQDIDVGNKVVPDFTVTKSGDFAPVTVTCDPATTQFADSFSWIVNKDGVKVAESTDAKPSFELKDPGTYDIILTATNAYSSESKTISEIVKIPVKAGFTSIVDGLDVTFNDTSSGTPTIYAWNFGDNQISTDSNPNHTYAHSGTYNVILTVTNADDSVNSTNADVTVIAAAPVAVLDVSPVNGIAPLDVAIADNSTGEIVSRVLYVDDVIADTVLDHYNFTTAGKHTLKLSVTNVGGGSTDTKTIDVYEPVVPSFTLDKNSGKVPLTVTATCTVPKVEGCTDVCNWLNDMGEAKLGENAAYTFNDPGDYNIKMQFTRTYPNGQTVEFDSEPKIIKAIPLEPPVPGILMNPVSGNGEIPLKVIFTSTATGATTTSWDFGDKDSSENTATGDVVSHSYDKVGTYTVTQTVTNDDGSVTTTATVNAIHTSVPPVAGFTMNPSTGKGTVPLDVKFYSTSATSLDKVSWTFGDVEIEQPTVGKDVEHIYSSIGTYTVTQTITNADDTKTATGQITVNHVPTPAVADFTTEPVNGNAPLSVVITDKSQYTDVLNGQVSYHFTDDTPDSNERSLTHIFSNVGTYTITQSVKNDDNQLPSTKNVIVTVNAALIPLVANFTAVPITGQAPLPVQFTDASTGIVAGYSWNFSDGTALNTTKNPSHVFASAGNYNVVLTVTDSNGGSSTKSMNIIATVAPIPLVANFTAVPTTGQAPLTVQFTDASTGSVTGYSWNFSDGTALNTTKNPSHVFAIAGNYNVVLTVKDNNGGSSTKSMNINATVAPIPLNADFTAAPNTGSTPLIVQFTDTSKGAVASRSWDFNDGNVDTTQSPKHTFTGVKTYNVVLTVKDNNGVSSTKTMPITVNAATNLKAIFTATPVSGNAPLVVKFEDQSTGASLRTWNFGDNSGVSTASKPSHTYNSVGTFIVTLTAINGTRSNVATKTITVTKPTLVINDITPDVTTGNAPLTVNFNCAVTGKPTYYAWTFERTIQQITYSGSVKHVYNSAGSYDVTLVVKDAYGNTAKLTKTKFITVLPKIKPPVAAFTATPKSVKAGMTVKFTDTSSNKPETWTWNFGDKSTVTSVNSQPNPSHQYNIVGKYSVTLTVRNKGGSDVKTYRNLIVVNKK